MNETCQQRPVRKTYYVSGSGLIAVPHARVNEISRLRTEFHAEEERRAMMLARARKLA